LEFTDGFAAYLAESLRLSLSPNSLVARPPRGEASPYLSDETESRRLSARTAAKPRGPELHFVICSSKTSNGKKLFLCYRG